MASEKGLSVKAIIKDKDNWQQYQEAYGEQVTADQMAEVEKMLGCGELSNGFATYICLSCGEQLKVAFSCKSRACSSCGKAHADEWSKQLAGRMFNVVHRHITFTVPSELWPYFEANPDWRDVLFQAANQTLRQIMRGEPGIAMVLHPYGKDLKANYHLHVLVTEGGLDEADQWQGQSYLSYAGLRKIWQAEVLSRLRGVMGMPARAGDLIDRLFVKYTNGFYVHAEPRVTDGEGISRYIGRYVRHPAIADSRIVAYDGERVTFSYQERLSQGKRGQKLVTLPVLEFIHGIVRHIPPKQFKMVRYGGLYAPRKISRVREIIAAIGKVLKRKVYRLGWRGRIKRAFGRDPLRCPRCGQPDMELYRLTIRRGTRLVTIGGLKWLWDRGSIRDIEPPHPPPIQVQPQPIQLPFSFPMSP